MLTLSSANSNSAVDSTLVNQIVEIARLEGHVTDIEMTPENMDEAFEDVIDALDAQIRQREVIVHVVAQGTLPTVLADSRGLRTMLTNLLQNAVTHSPAGGVVHVAAARIGAGGPQTYGVHPARRSYADARTANGMHNAIVATCAVW